MLGFLIGTVCLVGLVRMLRGHGHGRFGGYGSERGCGGSRWHGGGPWGRDRGGLNDWRDWRDDEDDDSGAWSRGGRGGRGGFMLRALFERLDTTPGQEKTIRAALDGLRARAREVKTDARDARGDLAKAFRGETLDADTLGAVAAHATTAVDGVRDAAIGALLEVHAVLEPRQREILADLLERGPRFGRSGRSGRGRRSPYRDVAEV